MSAPILLKRTNIPGRVPTISDLALGELAVNTHDGKLFFKKDTGVGSPTIIEAGTGGSGSGTATITIGTVTTGAAGSQAQVTNTGTATDAVFNFTIPEGQPASGVLDGGNF